MKISLQILQITEKIGKALDFSLNYGLVPVVFGGQQADYNEIAPNSSFINVEDFKSVKDLANELKRVINNAVELVPSFYHWHFQYDKADCYFIKRGFGNLCKRLFAEDSTGCKSNPFGEPKIDANETCFPPFQTVTNLRTPFGNCYPPTIVG